MSYEQVLFETNITSLNCIGLSRYFPLLMELQGNTIMTQLCSVEQERDPIERIRKLLLSLEIASVSDLKVD